jgi:hypothetical protein
MRSARVAQRATHRVKALIGRLGDVVGVAVGQQPADLDEDLDGMLEGSAELLECSDNPGSPAGIERCDINVVGSND